MDERIAETLADEQVKLLTSQLATKAEMAALAHDIEQLRLGTKADIAGLAHDTEQLRQETKADIEQLRQETKGGIENLRLEVDYKLEKVKSDMIRWIAAFGLTIIALNLAGFALLLTQMG